MPLKRTTWLWSSRQSTAVSGEPRGLRRRAVELMTAETPPPIGGFVRAVRRSYPREVGGESLDGAAGDGRGGRRSRVSKPQPGGRGQGPASDRPPQTSAVSGGAAGDGRGGRRSRVSKPQPGGRGQGPASDRPPQTSAVPLRGRGAERQGGPAGSPPPAPPRSGRAASSADETQPPDMGNRPRRETVGSPTGRRRVSKPARLGLRKISASVWRVSKAPSLLDLAQSSPVWLAGWLAGVSRARRRPLEATPCGPRKRAESGSLERQVPRADVVGARLS